MKININYLSLVAIGNFNPAILTPDFLNDVCQLNLGEPTHITPPEIPVHKHIKFKNLDIEALLEHLVIKETGPEDIYESYILRIFDNIYRTLQFTPLKVVGVNVNCDLIDDTNTRADKLELLISNPDTLLSFFEVNQIDVTEKFLQIISEKKWISSNYRIDNVRELVRHINVAKKKNSCNINYNYEAGPLHKDKSKLDLLLGGYKSFCDEFFNFIKYLEGLINV